jgi:phage terminase large subunit
VKKVVESTYRPREVFLSLHARSQRYASIIAHRRCGKTVAAINDLIDKAVQCPLPHPRYAYVAPFYSQAKTVAWDYLKDFTRPIAIETRESELSVTVRSAASSTPARIRLFGSDNPHALRGQYFDGVVVDEFGDCSPRLFGEIIRPALSDRRGWALFIGTPRGPNHFYDLHRHARADEDWLTLELPASRTGLIDADELREAKKQMTEDEYEVEFECSFEAAVPGAFYGQIMKEMREEGRLLPLAPDPNKTMFTGWDLGVTDDTSIIFAQKRPDGGYDIVDFFSESGESIEEIVDTLRTKPYEYGRVFLPHDARARSLRTGRTLVEQMYSLGVRGMEVIPALPVVHGIQAVRQFLGTARICTTRCENLITALTLYQREWDPGKKAFRPKPRHDWTSNPADAMRSLANGIHPKRNFDSLSPVTKKNEQSGVIQPTSWSLEQLWRERDERRSTGRV